MKVKLLTMAILSVLSVNVLAVETKAENLEPNKIYKDKLNDMDYSRQQTVKFIDKITPDVKASNSSDIKNESVLGTAPQTEKKISAEGKPKRVSKINTDKLIEKNLKDNKKENDSELSKLMKGNLVKNAYFEFSNGNYNNATSLLLQHIKTNSSDYKTKELLLGMLFETDDYATVKSVTRDWINTNLSNNLFDKAFLFVAAADGDVNDLHVVKKIKTGRDEQVLINKLIYFKKINSDADFRGELELFTRYNVLTADSERLISVL